MKKTFSLLLVLITLLAVIAPSLPAQAASCEAGPSGVCTETLPKLYCCSAAFLGWSEIVVGDAFPVSGKVAEVEGAPTATAVQIRFPSGRTEVLPVGSGGGFGGTVAFTEEGDYRLLLESSSGTTVAGGFQAAYRTELVSGGLLAASEFGAQHARAALSTVMVPAGQPATLRVRFTDAAGEPVRSRTLAIGFADQRYTTDGDGIATISFTPDDAAVGYRVDRLYPGLAVRSYREIRIDGSGLVTGLPGGEVRGFQEEGRLYLPLRAFLESAAPLRFGGQIFWNGELRTIEVEGFRLMADTGLVLGGTDFRSDLRIINGSTYMELDSLLQLLNQLGMAHRTGDNTFRLSLAQEP